MISLSRCHYISDSRQPSSCGAEVQKPTEGHSLFISMGGRERCPPPHQFLTMRFLGLLQQRVPTLRGLQTAEACCLTAFWRLEVKIKVSSDPLHPLKPVRENLPPLLASSEGVVLSILRVFLDP